MTVPNPASGPSPSNKLPPNPSAEFLRKLAKDRLRAMRETRPETRLFEAQLQTARDHGFASWREMIAHLNQGQRGQVKRDGRRVQIEGVGRLQWSGEVCTYCRALETALKVVGPEHDYVRLLGDNALAFRVRFWTNDEMTASCPSSPVGEMRPWTEFTQRSIGWQMRWDINMSPQREGAVDMSDRLDEITASIDAGIPVLGYISAWDMGIIYGYEGSKLLVRDFYLAADDATRDISECRGLFSFFEQRTTVPAQAESARFAITEGASRWSHGPDRQDRNGQGAYYYGLDAYDRWTDLLKRADAFTTEQLKPLLHVNYWTFISLHDARQKAAPYLRAVAELFPQAKESISAAADAYDQIGKMTGRVIHEGKMFLPFYMPESFGKWTPQMRSEEIEMLSEIRRIDEGGMQHLRAAAQNLS